MSALIICIGKDGLQHLCYPQAQETLCGKPIANKKPGSRDWKRYTCIACDYAEVKNGG